MKNAQLRDGADLFLAALHGKLVECDSVEDAAILRRAERVLNGIESASPRELRNMATVLLFYNCTDAASAIAHKVAMLRAEQFLADSVGYVRQANLARGGASGGRA